MNIILFRTDKLGDMIVSSPVIRAIHSAHPHARIMVVASPYNAAAVRGLDEVESVVLYEKTMDWFSQVEVIRELRAFEATHTLVLSPKTHCYILAALSRAPQRGGILMEYRYLARMLAPFLLTHSVFIPTSRKDAHQSERAVTLAANMGLAKSGEYPYLLAQDERAFIAMGDRLAAAGITKPFIAVHLADKWIDEAWQSSDVLAFLDRLKAELKLPVVATAGPVDHHLSEAVEKHFPLLKGLDFAQWVGVLRHSASVVTPDCGAAHIACALQKPLLALYQPSRFERSMHEFGPRGTQYKAYALDNPAIQTDIFINDLRTFLQKAP